MVTQIPQYELHRHIDLSFRAKTLFEFAQAQGLVPQSTSLENFKKKFLITEPVKDLVACLKKFEIYAKVLNRPEKIIRITEEVIADCYAEGTRGVELRFSPTFLAQFSKLSWQEILDAFLIGQENAAQKFRDIKTGFICIVGRNAGPDTAAKVVEFFLENQKHFIGIDLADDEINYPCRLFAEAFKPLKNSNANITIHSGEATGPENIWEAIELLGAQRIGHGVTCIEDPTLMKFLAEKQIPLEVCPTSNWLTRVNATHKEHPLRKILRAGVPATINTDDPGIFATSLPQEIKICREEMKLSEEQMASCFKTAYEKSFLNS